MSRAVVDGVIEPIGLRHCAELSSAIGVDQMTDITPATATGTAMTGVVVRFAANGTQAGAGALRYTNTGDFLAYMAPGDVSFGSDVDCSTDGNKTLTSANGKTLSVTVTAASLPGADATYYINIGVPQGARAVLISPLTQAVNLRADDVAPTAAIGINVPALSSLLWTAGGLSRMQFIEVTASAKVSLQFFSS